MKTTKADFKYFVARCGYWQKELGLMDWSIHITHEALEDKYANTIYGDESGVATIQLGLDWGEPPVTQEQLNRTALHECCHLLFSNLSTEAKARYASEYDIDRAEHHIIRVLENLITGVRR